MHELSIAMSLLDVAEEESERRGGVRIEALHLKLGPLSGVVKEALLSAFELAREETPLSNSRLIIEEVPILVYCANCRSERPVHSIQEFSCAECDAPAYEVLHGRELELTALELAD